MRLKCVQTYVFLECSKTRFTHVQTAFCYICLNPGSAETRTSQALRGMRHRLFCKKAFTPRRPLKIRSRNDPLSDPPWNPWLWLKKLETLGEEPSTTSPSFSRTGASVKAGAARCQPESQEGRPKSTPPPPPPLPLARFRPHIGHTAHTI